MRLRRFALPLALVAIATPGHALRLNVTAAIPFVYIQIGNGLLSSYGLFGPPFKQVNVVGFQMPTPESAGDGIPIDGDTVIPFAFLGYTSNRLTNYVVTMDSSSGLINDMTGDMIPFTEIGWATQDGDIPSGQFDGSANQILQEYIFHGNRARGVVDYLSFSYANSSVRPGGTYSGRVVYTITQL